MILDKSGCTLINNYKIIIFLLSG